MTRLADVMRCSINNSGSSVDLTWRVKASSSEQNVTFISLNARENIDPKTDRLIALPLTFRGTATVDLPFAPSTTTTWRTATIDISRKAKTLIFLRFGCKLCSSRKWQRSLHNLTSTLINSPRATQLNETQRPLKTYGRCCQWRLGCERQIPMMRDGSIWVELSWGSQDQKDKEDGGQVQMSNVWGRAAQLIWFRVYPHGCEKGPQNLGRFEVRKRSGTKKWNRMSRPRSQVPFLQFGVPCLISFDEQHFESVKQALKIYV